MNKKISFSDFKIIKERLLRLSTTYFCDACPTIRIMNGQINTLNPSLKLIGQAFTVTVENNINVVLKAIHHAEADDVIVVDSGGCQTALGGEIFATLGKRKNLAGIIIDGACRDAEGIKRLGFPYYAKSTYPAKNVVANKGKYQVGIICGDVPVNPYDIIFADDSGIIVLTEQELEILLPQAEAIFEKEQKIFQKINDGYSIPDIFPQVSF